MRGRQPAKGSPSSYRPSRLRLPSRAMMPSTVQASRELIFELPRVRSTNVTGVSATRQPSRLSCQSISSWNE